MLNIQSVVIPFDAAFDIHTYLEGVGVSVISSGVYFAPAATLDDFESYQTGIIYHVSGSGLNSGFWSSGLFNSYLFYYANSFENSTTGFFTGNNISGSFLRSGYSSFSEYGGKGTVFSFECYLYDNFQNYTPGPNSGPYDSGIVRSGYSILAAQAGYIQSDDIYNAMSFNGEVTGFNTGVFDQGFQKPELPIAIYGYGETYCFNDDNYTFDDFTNYPTGVYKQYTLGVYPSGNFASGVKYFHYNLITTGSGAYTRSDPTVINNKGTLTGYFINSGKITGGYTGFKAYGVNTLSSTGFFYYPHTGNLVVGNFTLEMWLNRSSNWSGVTGSTFVDKNIKSGIFIAQSGTGSGIVFGINNVSGYSNFFMPSGKWIHMAFQRSGTSGIFFTGGKLQNSFVVNTGLLSGNNNFYFGNRFDYTGNNHPFIGIFDEVRFWNYARTRENISGNFTGRVDKYQSGLLLYMTP